MEAQAELQVIRDLLKEVVISRIEQELAVVEVV